MRFRTRRWVDGDVSDAEEAEIDAAFDAHRATVVPTLPQPLQLLGGVPDDLGYVSLHDGRIEWWVHDGPRSLTVQVFGGDDPIGYRRLVIQYRGDVEILGASAGELAAWFDRLETEILYTEVDAAGNGRFEHRMILWPTGELGVRFSDLSVLTAPVPGETYTAIMRRKRLESSRVFARAVHAYEAGRRRRRDLLLRLDDVRPDGLGRRRP